MSPGSEPPEPDDDLDLGQDIDLDVFDQGAFEAAPDYDPTEHMTQAELDELEREADAVQDEYEAGLVREAIRNLSKDTARVYLGRYGDAVDGRITACLTESKQLVAASHPGPALTLAATAMEISIRFLLLQPLVQGAFLSERWAAILAEQVTSGRTASDRELLPRILRELDIDVNAAKTASGVPVWSFFLGTLRPRRDRFVHRADPVDAAVAAQAIECAEAFRSEVVEAVAKRLGFTLDVTHCWATIHKGTVNGIALVDQIHAADPFAQQNTTVHARTPRQSWAPRSS